VAYVTKFQKLEDIIRLIKDFQKRYAAMQILSRFLFPRLFRLKISYFFIKTVDKKPDRFILPVFFASHLSKNHQSRFFIFFYFSRRTD